MTSCTPKTFIFVLMPFDSQFDNVYELGIKDACKESDAFVERADSGISEGTILERIYNKIAKADLIIADMTGKNSNVFYEVGYAHALRKRVLILTQNEKDIPFDLTSYHRIIYDSKKIAELRKQLIVNLTSQETMTQNLGARQLCAFLYGAGVDKIARNDFIFQDFDLKRDRESKANVNAVQSLWADPFYGGKIQARRVSYKEDPKHWLQVTFVNETSAYPCSVAIRGMNESPIEKPPEARYMVIPVRIPTDPLNNNINSEDKIAISIRVINGWLQHWIYGEGPETFFQYPVKCEYSEFKIDLHKASMWYRFVSEGNPWGPNELPPDFTFIASVVIEVGINKNENRLKDGSATLEIGPISLSS